MKTAHRQYDSHRLDIDLSLTRAKTCPLVAPALREQLDFEKEKCTKIDGGLVGVDVNVRSHGIESLDVHAAKDLCNDVFEAIKMTRETMALIETLLPAHRK